MIDQLIDEIIKRESVKDTNNPNDSGGETKYGISKRWHPEAWTNGPPTLDAAKTLFLTKYFVATGIIHIQPDYLMSQLADFAVLSGPVVAVQHLQKVLGLTADGQLGVGTLAAVAKRDPITLNNQLVDDRVLMLDRIVQKRPSDVEFIYGWHSRALSFRK